MEREILKVLGARGVETHFWSKVKRVEEDDCWLWTSSLAAGGYGMYQVPAAGGKGILMAHRVSWVLKNQQEIPEGQVVAHSCNSRTCVNPAHLSVKSRQDACGPKRKPEPPPSAARIAMSAKEQDRYLITIDD